MPSRDASLRAVSASAPSLSTMSSAASTIRLRVTGTRGMTDVIQYRHACLTKLGWPPTGESGRYVDANPACPFLRRAYDPIQPRPGDRERARLARRAARPSAAAGRL